VLAQSVAEPYGRIAFPESPDLRSPFRWLGNNARIKLNAGHIGWADMIFCMEKKHAARIVEKFTPELGDKPLIVLRIPDEFGFMDPALIRSVSGQ
jgi:predicted protein tyrosine phosphatase